MSERDGGGEGGVESVNGERENRNKKPEREERGKL